MRLSQPIHRLKSEAKRLARERGVPHLSALDLVAAREGYGSWSLLAASADRSSPASALLAQLSPGDLVLIAARPGQGKTLLALELAAEAAKAGSQAAFFTFEYTQQEVGARLSTLGIDSKELGGRFHCDSSDAISADYIIGAVRNPVAGTLVVVDYLQLLDQRRENPPVADQVGVLRAWARTRGAIVAFISQVDRNYDPQRKSLPDRTDIRLPNPLDLDLFDKACFLNDGSVSMQA